MVQQQMLLHLVPLMLVVLLPMPGQIIQLLLDLAQVAPEILIHSLVLILDRLQLLEQ